MNQNQSQNVHLFDPQTQYISAILTGVSIKKMDPETPAKSSPVANAEDIKVWHRLIIITHCSIIIKK